MGADIKYSVSFFILFFYFLCLFLGAYQQNVSIHATKRFYTRDKTFLYMRQNVSIHETKHFHTLHKKFLIVRRFVYTKKNLISDKNDSILILL